ncbi:hypothetical protein QAD02_005905 [Eretmocerus hayati]|uniref:Uncharacterized protein n=1 Tax=Eretmocerus hayati TaxID=131215 RepID=A0ACC2N002_9HYME|nr:hypothetical protein QAD02_005905 [Eretmocerus hayati]
MMIYIVCLLVFLNVGFGSSADFDPFALDPDEFKLEQVQVLFRHGDRTPRKQEIYKNDPYQLAYSNIGYGNLTDMGRDRMMKVGSRLRDLYGDFLGKTGIEEVLAYYAGSTRTEISLRILLAGLFSSTRLVFVNNEKPKMPLTLHNDSAELNFLTTGMDGECSPQYFQKVEQNLNVLTWESRSRGLYNFDMISLIANLTGVRPTLLALTWLYYNLDAVEHMGLQKPQWCSKVDCSYLKDVAKLFAKSLTVDEWMKRITAGPLLQQFLKNMENSASDQKKLHLYSAHDFQIITLTQTLNFASVPELPDYGSCITIEKIRGERDGRAYVRMIIRTGEKTPRVIPLYIQGCDFYCPIETFSMIVRPFFPSDRDWDCPETTPQDINIVSYSLSEKSKESNCRRKLKRKCGPVNPSEFESEFRS